MATPHISGVAALLLEASPQLTPAGLRDAIIQRATTGVVLNASSSSNHLPYTGSTSVAAPTEPAPAPSPVVAAISLTARGYKVSGRQRVDLSWSGATASSVDIFRNGARLTTVSNSGRHTDAINNKGGGSYRYKVCHAGDQTVCSVEATVSF